MKVFDGADKLGPKNAKIANSKRAASSQGSIRLKRFKRALNVLASELGLSDGSFRVHVRAGVVVGSVEVYKRTDVDVD